jgi:hypothetical protein
VKKKVREYVTSLLGEGIHTAFRKVPVLHGNIIHDLIEKMPTEDWASVIDFAFDGIEKFIDPKKVEASIKRDDRLVARAQAGGS